MIPEISDSTRDKINTSGVTNRPSSPSDPNVGKDVTIKEGIYEGLTGVLYSAKDFLHYTGSFGEGFTSLNPDESKGKPYIVMMYYEDGTFFCAVPADQYDLDVEGGYEPPYEADGSITYPYFCFQKYTIKFQQSAGDTGGTKKAYIDLGSQPGKVYLDWVLNRNSTAHAWSYIGIRVKYVGSDEYLFNQDVSDQLSGYQTKGEIEINHEPEFAPSTIVLLEVEVSGMHLGSAIEAGIRECPEPDGSIEYPYVYDSGDSFKVSDLSPYFEVEGNPTSVTFSYVSKEEGIITVKDAISGDTLTTISTFDDSNPDIECEELLYRDLSGDSPTGDPYYATTCQGEFTVDLSTTSGVLQLQLESSIEYRIYVK